MSDHPQISKGHVLFAVLLVLFLFLMAFNEIRSRPAVHSIFFIVLLGGCIVASVALDTMLFERKRKHSVENKEEKKPTYHPNLRIWAVGMISGIGATLIYLISVVTLSLVRLTEVTQQILYQYALLFVVLTVAIAFTIWGIVQVCRNE